MATSNFLGFLILRPDGTHLEITLQRRTFNTRPYAVYYNGDQSAAFNTYINRGSCERAIRKHVDTLRHNCPDFHIIELHGLELVRT